jgi:hypothetical protein
MDVRGLISVIKQRRQEIAESMVNGHCVNFESYQRLVGQSMGLNETLEFINQLLEEERKDVE